MVFDTEDDIYRYFEDLMSKHLRICRYIDKSGQYCDMDNSCEEFDRLVEKRSVYLKRLKHNGAVVISL